MTARVLAVGRAVPERRFEQDVIRARCAQAFSRVDVLDNAGVAVRHLVEEPDWYFSGRPFDERNEAYFKHGLELARRALTEAVERSGVKWGELTHLFSVTTTGLLTPSLEAHLAHELPMARTIKRTPLFGVGCAGGAVALSRAAEYLRGHPGEAVAVLSVELCSLSFLPEDGTMTQLIAAALFGDGAAAVVLCGPEHPAAARGALEIVENRSVLFAESLHVMGWEFGAHGMRLVLSPDAPAFIEREAAAAVAPLVDGRPLSFAVIHPGSARILAACEEALGVDAALSRRFLARYGNLSSASVLFILGDALEQAAPGWGLLASFGPGFACEALLLRR